MSDQAASPAAESGPAPLPAATEPSFDNALASRLAEMTGDRDREDDAPADRTPQDRDTAHPDSAKPADAEPEAAKAEDGEPEYKLKLKVDGKEEERTFKHSELTERLQKAEAAQKRFEEAAAVRKAAESEGRAAAQERAQLAQALQHFTAKLQASAPPEPDQSLLNSDPVEYLRQQHQYQQHFQQAQQATAAQAHLMRQEQAAQEQWYRSHLEAESAALVKAIPEWWAEVEAMLGPLLAAGDEAPLADQLDLLATAGEALCGTGLWANADGRALSAFIEELREAARAAGTTLERRELHAQDPRCAATKLRSSARDPVAATRRSPVGRPLVRRFVAPRRRGRFLR